MLETIEFIGLCVAIIAATGYLAVRRAIRRMQEISDRNSR